MDISLIISIISILAALVICYHQILKSRKLALLNEVIKRMEIVAQIAAKSFDKDVAEQYSEYFFHKNIAKYALNEFLNCRSLLDFDYRYQHRDLRKQFEEWVEFIEFDTQVETIQSFDDDRQKAIIYDVYARLSKIIGQLMSHK